MLLEYFRCSCSKHCHYNSKWRESNLQQALQNGGHRGLCLLSSSSFPLGKRQRVTSALLGTRSHSQLHTAVPGPAAGTSAGDTGQHGGAIRGHTQPLATAGCGDCSLLLMGSPQHRWADLGNKDLRTPVLGKAVHTCDQQCSATKT